VNILLSKYRNQNTNESRCAKEYEVAAQKFINSSEKGIETYKRANGDIVRYNKATNEFGIADKDGTIRTYFKN
jgi:pyocin large subunit-like protein